MWFSCWGSQGKGYIPPSWGKGYRVFSEGNLDYIIILKASMILCPLNILTPHIQLHNLYPWGKRYRVFSEGNSDYIINLKASMILCPLNILTPHIHLANFSVQFSHSVVSDSLQPHRLQHARLPCPSPAPRVCSDSCPLSQWCHPTISSSVIPFSSYLQSFPPSGSCQWVSSSHQVAKVLEFQLQHQSFQWIFRTDFL